MTRDLKILERVHRFAKTRELASRAARDNPRDLRALFGAGMGFALSGDLNGALGYLKSASDIDPANPFVQYELGMVHDYLGDPDSARACFALALRSQPKFHKAWQALVSVEKQTLQNNHIPDLERQFRLPDEDGWRSLHIGHALAKTYEDLGNLETSFAWLDKAKATRRHLHPYLARDRELLTDAAISSTALLPEKISGHASEETIFVCGMPRTGTTLVDRILSSHPDVSSAGEISNFFQLFKLFSPGAAAALLDPVMVTAVRDVDFAELGRAYIASTRPLTGHRPRFIDKAPGNYLIAGTILKALPNARIVCLRRHPLDTVLSNYKQIFPIDDRFYDYVYDLGAAAHQYIQFDRLIRHLQSTLPADRFMIMDYDALVSDQETHTRALLAFCGLTWDPRCLEFQKNASGVATPSAQQVRQAMYTSSSGRFEKYGTQLDPARVILQRAGLL